jgi:ADP-ribosylation factor-binding protein GGA
MPSMASYSTPQPHSSPQPNYSAFAAMTSALPSSKPATPTPGQTQPKAAPIDPFAALVSGSSRSATPSGQRNSLPPSTNNQASLLELSQPSAPAPVSTNTAPPQDDEWNFTSALPTEPEMNTVTVHSSTIGITFTAKRQPSTPTNIHIIAKFSNTTTSPITGLHFQVAVEKSYSLQLRPQTSREVPANGKDAVQQEILLSGVPVGKGGAVKMRYKVSCVAEGQNREEQGTVPSLGIQ